ncbi:MAG TPA: hypothetical protein VK922_16975 [Gemmatimonadaceae bacterium]|nr:hypothetical protein [Gemmatimonadaceae bacterium]
MYAQVNPFGWVEYVHPLPVAKSTPPALVRTANEGGATGSSAGASGPLSEQAASKISETIGITRVMVVSGYRGVLPSLLSVLAGSGEAPLLDFTGRERLVWRQPTRGISKNVTRFSSNA